MKIVTLWYKKIDTPDLLKHVRRTYTKIHCQHKDKKSERKREGEKESVCVCGFLREREREGE